MISKQKKQPVAPANEKFNKSDEPILELYRRYYVLEAASIPLETCSDALRAGLVARYGELGEDRSASKFWAHDPDYFELIRLNTEIDQLQYEKDVVIEELVATSAVASAGATAKLRIGLNLWRGLEMSNMDFYEVATLAFMEDAARMLTELQP